MTFRKWLKANGACQDSIGWCGNKTVVRLYREVTQPQWFLWLLSKLGFPINELFDLILKEVKRDSLSHIRESIERWIAGGPVNIQIVEKQTYDALFEQYDYYHADLLWCMARVIGGTDNDALLISHLGTNCEQLGVDILTSLKKHYTLEKLLEKYRHVNPQ